MFNEESLDDFGRNSRNANPEIAGAASKSRSLLWSRGGGLLVESADAE